MDFIAPIWTFAEPWQLRLLVLIVLLNMALALRLYGVMSKARYAAVKKGEVDKEIFRATQAEPEQLAVYTRAVANQFEAPVLFYAVIAIGMALGVTSWITVVLAAVYVALRWQHANEMIGEHNVLRRRQLFIWSFYALIALMVELAISALLWA
ncbi:MAPEG family protein [Pseudahrensia aquimaris]|uniref:MAPEG family protein n=1 Tax=Pseudahrensia aquimaris TaxID=744461 RepID=A0ABW3FGR3_9HYPH